MPSIESNQLLLAAAAACEDKKAEDIRILALDPAESGLTDYFLICNGTNDRQNVAITDEIEIRLKREFDIYPNSVEGRRQGEWILMDYVDFIVHVFSPEKRAFYGLERLRKSATTISVAELNADLKAAHLHRTRESAKEGHYSQGRRKAFFHREESVAGQESRARKGCFKGPRSSKSHEEGHSNIGCQSRGKDLKPAAKRAAAAGKTKPSK